MMEPVIVVHQLQAKVGVKIPVELKIDGAQFDAGKLHLLVGGNGAGKSTFLRTLLGFHPIQGGDITWCLPDRQRLVIKPDSRGFADLFQRVAYARAIAGDPDVLILDELEASLDEVVKRQLTRDFLAAGKKRTAIVVTHDKSSWLTGRWTKGDRIIWSFHKDARATVSLTREPVGAPTRPASPDGLFQAREELFAKLPPPLSPVVTPASPDWNNAGWVLCKALTSFIKAVVERPRMILTVFGPSIVSGNSNYGLPVLILGATGPEGEKLDGRDSYLLEQFASQSEPRVFPNPESHDPPAVGRRVVPKGLILELFRSGPAESYKGARLDEVGFGNVYGESFFLPRKSVDERGETPNYLELSHSTEAVYLFSVIGSSTQARLVTAIDIMNPCSLDEYQRYSVLEALCHTLKSLATA